MDFLVIGCKGFFLQGNTSLLIFFLSVSNIIISGIAYMKIVNSPFCVFAFEFDSRIQIE